MHFTLDDSPAVPTFVWEAPYAEDSEEARDALLLHPIRALEEHGLESWTRSGSPEQVGTSQARA